MNEPLHRLRQEMAKRGMDAYLLMACDFHHSEYVCDYFQSTRYLSHFTGENCTLVITPEEAMLWTDGRFFVQAEAQMDPEFTLCRMGVAGEPTVLDYLKKVLPENGCLGFDGRLITARQAKIWQHQLAAKKIRFSWEEDLIDLVWEDRPSISPQPAWLFPLTYTGRDSSEKLADVRAKMAQLHADVHVLTSLEDQAWLFNMRGNDIACTPVVFAYTLITEKETELFVYDGVISGELEADLKEKGVIIRPYQDFYTAIAAIPAGSRVLLSEKVVSMAITSRLPEGCRIVNADNPTAYLKCIKNPTEIACTRNSHIKDGVAMVRFSKWLKEHIGKEEITEISASDYLEKQRRAQPLNQGLSFPTISAYGPNAAMMHYIATPESCAVLKPEGFLLVDSGGHYLDGTTDITRTYVLGPITETMKKHYTSVVRGMLNLSGARFLEGLTGLSLDYLAREPMWALGIDYRCGTGHGVGYLLSVHEGPNEFRPFVRPGSPQPVALKPGMITTDEPGIYLDHQYGIRCENELLCVEDEENEYGRFLKFELITYCPIDLDGIDTQYMTKREIRLLNEYHEKVYQTLKDHLTAEEASWLREATRPVE